MSVSTPVFFYTDCIFLTNYRFKISCFVRVCVYVCFYIFNSILTNSFYCCRCIGVGVVVSVVSVVSVSVVSVSVVSVVSGVSLLSL